MGRDEELGVLAAALEGAAGGVVAVHGEPGMGTTRLLAEVRVRAAMAGCLVRWGRAAEQQGPFGVFVAAVDGVAEFVEAGREPVAVCRAVRQVLAELAGDNGLVLVLDDLHWADDGSVELIDHLVRHPPRARVLLVLGYRTRQASPGLRGALAGVRQVELGPPNESRGGNPFYFDESAAKRALGRELAALTETQLRVGRAAAVAGDPFDPALVAHIAGVAQETALEALDGLCRRDVVRPVGSTRRFAFRHPMVGRLLYRGSDAEHARAEEWLRVRGASAVQRAPHLSRAGADAALLVEAAGSVLLSEPETAVRWLEAARSTAPEASVRLMLAQALTALGRLAEAREVLVDVLEDVADRVDVVIRLARVERLLGRATEAQELLAGELERAPDSAKPALLMEIASGCQQAGQFAATQLWASRAMIQAHRVEPRQHGTEAAVTGLLALGHASTGETAAAGAYATAAATKADELVDAQPEALVWTGWAEVAIERFGAATRHFTRAVDQATAGELIPESLLGLASARAWMGALDDAWAGTEDALVSARRMNCAELVTRVLVRRCQIALWQGRVDEALAIGAEAAGAPSELWARVGAGMLAQVRVAAGQPADAVRELLQAGGGPDLGGLGTSMRPAWYDVLTEAELARGRLAEANRWAGRARACADRLELPGRHGYASLARARVQRAEGLHGEAAVSATRAAESFASSGVRILEGQALALAGGALLDAGRLDDAHRALARAKLVFAECGAREAHRRALDELRRLGASKPRRKSPGGPDGFPLTEREQEVAELIGTGMTNRQIADRLKLSTKTVETHLGRVFTKLSVSSRSAVAARLPAPR